MEYTLSMIFMAENGEKSTMTVSGVSDAITESEVSQLMDTLIAENIFINKNGLLVAKHSAKVTGKEVTAIEI